MKYAIMLGLLVFSTVSIASAEWVNGYFRKDGTYVNGYYRTDRNNTVYDNLSYDGDSGYNSRSKSYDDYFKQKSYYNDSYNTYDNSYPSVDSGYKQRQDYLDSLRGY